MNREVHRSAITKCAMCNGPLTQGVPLFWRVTFDRLGVDRRAVQQVAGMETFFGGNTAIANVFTGDPVIAKPIGERVDVLICEPCMLAPQNFALLALEPRGD